MSTKPQSKKSITVNQVGIAALFLAIVGGVYGLYTGGLMRMALLFVEWFVAGFVISYIVASFIVLFQK
jgi:hypothetical protein